MDDLYRDYILEHYRRPHNFGVLDAPTASYEGSNPLCGDRITMMLGIHDGVVSEVAFTGRGCAISQASASLLTDEIKGKTVAAVEAMTPDDLLDLLGIDISPARLKCALLSLDTVAHALTDESVVEGKPPSSRVRRERLEPLDPDCTGHRRRDHSRTAFRGCGRYRSCVRGVVFSGWASGRWTERVVGAAVEWRWERRLRSVSADRP